MADVVHMLADTTGSPNGLDVYSYHEGENYAVGDPKMTEYLAGLFVDNGSAEMKSGRVDDSKPAPKDADGGGRVLSPADEKPGDRKR